MCISAYKHRLNKIHICLHTNVHTHHLFTRRWKNKSCHNCIKFAFSLLYIDVLFYPFILNVYHLFFLKPEHNSILPVGLEHLHKSLVTKTNQERSKCLTSLGIKQCFPSHLDESVKKGKTDKFVRKKLKY